MRIYNWLGHCLNNKKQEKIQIVPDQSRIYVLPVHVRKQTESRLSAPIIKALGGIDNIETFRPIPNSRRIRITIANPNLINRTSLEKIDVNMFIRIGKKIIHIIP